jgi:hypothetical protein
VTRKSLLSSTFGSGRAYPHGFRDGRSSIPSGDSSNKLSAELLRAGLCSHAELATFLWSLRSINSKDCVHLLRRIAGDEAALKPRTESGRRRLETSGLGWRFGAITKQSGQKSKCCALDSICQQKDCHASKLYWYTDLEQAKSAAQAQGKLILSLRLLGRLDEDLSCANSRLFRITLYANEQCRSSCANTLSCTGNQSGRSQS